MKTINVSFEDSEMEEIEKSKKGQSWREFIRGCAEKKESKYKEIKIKCPNCKRELRFVIDTEKEENIWVSEKTNPLKDVRDAIEILEGDKKPPCTEICADPRLIRVVDGHGADMEKETEIEASRAWQKIKNCPLKNSYKCQWEKY